MQKRVGVIGIVVKDREQVAEKVNQILSKKADLIRGRLGVPFPDQEISTISVIVEGTSDDIGALTGRLGNIEGVTLKSALTSYTIQD